MVDLYRRVSEDGIDATATSTVVCGGVGAARFLRGLQRRRAAGADRRHRQHRRRHRAPRAVDLPRPRHHHLHARRAPSTPSGAGAWPARRGRRWRPSPATPPCARPGSTAGDDVVQPRRPRPRHPPLPHGPPGRGRHADGDRRRDAPGVGPRRPAAADDRRRRWPRWSSWPTGEEVVVPGLLRAPAPRRAGRGPSASPATAAPTPSRAARRSTTAGAIVIAPSNPLVSIGPVRALPGVDEVLARAPRARRRRVADRRRRGAQGPGRPDARRARPRAVGGRRRPALRARSRRPSSSTPSTPSSRRPSRRPGMRAVVVPSVMSTPEVAAELARPTLAAAGLDPRCTPSAQGVEALGQRRPRRPGEVDPGPHRGHGEAQHLVGVGGDVRAAVRPSGATSAHRSRSDVCTPVPTLTTSPLPRWPDRTRASTTSST